MTTALACASGDPSLAVIAKTAIGRFYTDLSRPPYKTIFNASLRGARAFNAVQVQRIVEEWIEEKKQQLEQKKGLPWGLLVHGNRVLEAGVFVLLGREFLDKSIVEFRETVDRARVYSFAALIYESMLVILEREHEGRFMAVLFKSPSKGKDVVEKALLEIEALASRE